eukprot:gene3214-3520_t
MQQKEQQKQEGEDDFNFPFPPYPQQKALMRAIFNCIDQKAVGCLESPTGTGKTLSMICASFSWLIREEDRLLSTPSPPPPSSASGSGGMDGKGNAVDWLEALLQQEQQQEQQQSQQSSTCTSSSQATIAREHYQLEEDDEYLLDAYESENEKTKKQQQQDDDDDDDDKDEVVEDYRKVLSLPKIIFSSRTHSQLSQFLQEVKRTIFASRCHGILLASRKQLCLLPSVRNLTSEAAINDRCEDLRKGRKPSKRNHETGRSCKQVKKAISCCSYHSASAEQEMAWSCLKTLSDIEDLQTLGEQRGGCPFYATRRALRHANLIALPYALLVHHEMRQAIGLEIDQNTIVIVDEAHNLAQAASAVYSATLSVSTLMIASQATKDYLQAYRPRLSAKTVYYLTLLFTVLKKTRDYFLGIVKAGRECHVVVGSDGGSSDNTNLKRSTSSTESPLPSRQHMVTVNDFLFASGLDHINLFKLQRFLSVSRLQNKVGGFAERTNNNSMKARATLRLALQFVFCLTSQEGDGRIILEYSSSTLQTSLIPTRDDDKEEDDRMIVKYVLLNPGRPLESVLREARSVLLVGGTLRPFAHLTTTLLSSLPPTRLRLFSCGHIVSPDQIKVVATGSREVTHKTRLSAEVEEEIFEMLHELCRVVPAGLVVFFTSYQYMYNLVNRWKQSKRWDTLRMLKNVFVESHSSTGEGEEDDGNHSLPLWDRYCMAVPHGKGAMLCSVMGGRLSEGINFSDDLARAVVVIGLPFPDPRDLVLQERIKIYRSIQRQAGLDDRAEAFSEALCMTSVNQSIGRAIRHAADYASIVLYDRRYQTERIQSLLPEWIRGSLVPRSSALSVQEAVREVEGFFAHRKR